MSPVSPFSGCVTGIVLAVALGVVFSAWGGAGVVLLVLPAAVIFGATGALIGLIGSKLGRRSGGKD